MTAIEDVFLELLFGEGALLGCLLVMVIVLAVTSLPRMKYSTILFLPVTMLFGIIYLTNIPSSSIYMWCAIFMFMTMAYLVLRLGFGEDH